MHCFKTVLPELSIKFRLMVHISTKKKKKKREKKSGRGYQYRQNQLKPASRPAKYSCWSVFVDYFLMFGTFHYHMPVWKYHIFLYLTLKAFKFCLTGKKTANKHGKTKDLSLCLDSSLRLYTPERLSTASNSFLLSW